jgi:hypothetical protein
MHYTTGTGFSLLANVWFCSPSWLLQFSEQKLKILIGLRAITLFYSKSFLTNASHSHYLSMFLGVFSNVSNYFGTVHQVRHFIPLLSKLDLLQL